MGRSSMPMRRSSVPYPEQLRRIEAAITEWRVKQTDYERIGEPKLARYVANRIDGLLETSAKVRLEIAVTDPIGVDPDVA